jgi:hypothetical protein
MQPKHSAQVVNELPLGRIVRKNPSLILMGTIFGQTLFFFVAELWITRPSSLGTRGLKTTYSMQKPIAILNLHTGTSV